MRHFLGKGLVQHRTLRIPVGDPGGVNQQLQKSGAGRQQSAVLQLCCRMVQGPPIGQLRNQSFYRSLQIEQALIFQQQGCQRRDGLGHRIHPQQRIRLRSKVAIRVGEATPAPVANAIRTHNDGHRKGQQFPFHQPGHPLVKSFRSISVDKGTGFVWMGGDRLNHRKGKS